MKFIAACHGGIAKTVLLPGDPQRAEYLAKKYFDHAVCYTNAHGLCGYTGTWRGTPVSVQATGMGTLCIAECAKELIEDHDCKNLIRVGSCSSSHPAVHVGDIVLSLACANESNCHVPFVGDYDYIPTPSFTLIRMAAECAHDCNIPLHVGVTGCCDVLRRAPDAPPLIASEMEGTGLMFEAAKHAEVRTLLMMTCGGHTLYPHEIMPAERRTQDLYDGMMQIALHMAARMQKEAL